MMKMNSRTVTLVCLMLMVVPSMHMSAQEAESRWTVDFGISGPSIYSQYEDYWGIIDNYYSRSFPASIKEVGDNCFDLFVTPTFAVHASYSIKERWSVVSSIGYNHFLIKYFNPFTDEIRNKESTYAYDILLGPRFMISRGAGFYVQALFGFAGQGNSRYWDHNAEMKKASDVIPDWIPSWLGYQIDLGIVKNLGDRCFISGEFGLGTEHWSEIGGRLGIGLKL